jgi:NAD(P)-dependent dehydrogenase (short-subunit alcohol dehydrogenase family)
MANEQMTDQGTQVCLVIGAGPGLGQRVAHTFAKAGMTVVSVRRTGEDQDTALSEAPVPGTQITRYVCDATDPVALRELFDDVQTTLGPIEVVVFNVGRPLRAGVLETSPDEYRDMWQTNAYAGMLVGQQAVRVMQARSRGTVIFSGATASLRGGAGFSAFASAKSALRAFAQSLAREFGPQGIHVAHVVIDGGIDSAKLRQQQPERANNAGVDGLLNPQSIASAYLNLHEQPRDAWTFELDLRPWAERW